jgi:hypothetical protein
MGADAKTQASRDLVDLARKLRGFAAQTGDARYIALFLSTAESLEARAGALPDATGPVYPPLTIATCPHK